MSAPDPRAIVLAAMVALFAIRIPFALRSLRDPVERRRVGWLERAVLQAAKVAFVLPLVWVVAPMPRFAEYSPHGALLWPGTALLGAGLWLFYRSHADLGTNWSPTLETKRGHTLTTVGVYARLRHPMYLASLLFAAGLALVLPNYVVGPVCLAAMLLMVATRLGAEEAMLTDRFGEAYRRYQARTWRLVPGVW